MPKRKIPTRSTSRTKLPPIPAIEQVRSAVAAVMRIVIKRKGRHPKQVPQFEVGMVGTAWCVADSRHFVTAFHILNRGKKRDPADKFYLFLVPDNQETARRFPAIDFPLESEEYDLAILTIDPGDTPDKAASLPVALDDLEDGTQVVTCGFPAPQIASGKIDKDGNWLGGQFFLKSHANTGIVSAQYKLGSDDHPTYELNVAWHHGESGGPICRAEDAAAFSIMQSYRNIESPHGVVAGPHQGVSLRVIRQELEQLGAIII